MTGNNNTIRIPIKKWFYLLCLFVCIPTGIFILFFSLFSNELDEAVKDMGKSNIYSLLLQLVPASLVLLIIAILCVVASVFIIRKLMLGNSAVVITREGIDVKVSAIKTGLIKWSEIKEIKMETFNKQRVFTLLLLNPEILIPRQNKLTKFYYLHINKKSLYKHPIVFSPKTVKIKEQELLLLMLNYHNRYK